MSLNARRATSLIATRSPVFTSALSIMGPHPPMPSGILPWLIGMSPWLAAGEPSRLARMLPTTLAVMFWSSLALTTVMSKHSAARSLITAGGLPPVERENAVDGFSPTSCTAKRWTSSAALRDRCFNWSTVDSLPTRPTRRSIWAVRLVFPRVERPSFETRWRGRSV